MEEPLSLIENIKDVVKDRRKLTLEKTRVHNSLFFTLLQTHRAILSKAL